MASRKRFRLPPKQVQDLQAMFIAEAGKIARAAGALDAYWKSTGMLVELNRATAAVEALRHAARQASDSCPTEFKTDWARAMEYAALQARKAYIGQWWSVSRRLAAPERLEPGDEFYSRETVCNIVERGAPMTPDMTGAPVIIAQEAVGRRRR